jgi:uncharacterized protein YxjI
MSEVFLAAHHFAVTQRLTMMVNRYEIRALNDGAPGELFAMAQQKRMALRESVTFYADEDRRRPVFGFRADRKLDLGATYAVTDGAGRTIGSFRKDFARSLLRSTWHLDQPGMGSLRGQERNVAVAVLRRIWDFIPILSSIPFAWPLHFDFNAADGTPVLSVQRGMSLRDRYVVTVHNPALDRRLAAAVAVGLDALMSR